MELVNAKLRTRNIACLTAIFSAMRQGGHFTIVK